MIELLFACGLRVSELCRHGRGRSGRQPRRSAHPGERQQAAVGAGGSGGTPGRGGYLDGRARRPCSKGRRQPVSFRHRPRWMPDPAGLLEAAGAATAGKPAFFTGYRPTCCATASPPICWRAAPTCAACRPCWATPTSRPRRFIPTSCGRDCGKRWISTIHGLEARAPYRRSGGSREHAMSDYIYLLESRLEPRSRIG